VAWFDRENIRLPAGILFSSVALKDSG